MLKDYEVHYTVVYRMNVHASSMADAKQRADSAVKMRNGGLARVFKVLGPDHPERHASHILPLTDDITERKLRKITVPPKNWPPRSIDDL